MTQDAIREDMETANANVKSIDVKGKNYVMVNERIKAFRYVFPLGTISTEILEDDGERVTVKAYVYDGNTLLATGHAFEVKAASYINKTSYIENCETSAVGRALGNAGFGIDTSVASYEEVQNAINNQGQPDPDGILVCNKCGQVIDAKVHDYSARRYGRPLCRDCQRTEQPK